MDLMKISYLTWLHEKSGLHSEELDKPEHIKTIAELIDYLEEKDIKYKNTFRYKSAIYCALNEETVDHSALISNTDHLAFYSPIVGG